VRVFNRKLGMVEMAVRKSGVAHNAKEVPYPQRDGMRFELVGGGAIDLVRVPMDQTRVTVSGLDLQRTQAVLDQIQASLP